MCWSKLNKVLENKPILFPRGMGEQILQTKELKSVFAIFIFKESLGPTVSVSYKSKYLN